MLACFGLSDHQMDHSSTAVKPLSSPRDTQKNQTYINPTADFGIFFATLCVLKKID
jgi:hypothetical protein